MAILSKEEKQELLRFARSSKLKRDFQFIKSGYRASLLERREVNLDEYIKFLTFCSSFVGHKPKPFKKIEGSIFKI
jgi:hypothetical protein